MISESYRPHVVILDLLMPRMDGYELATYMKGDDVRIHVSLAAGDAESTVWGCDLSDGYVRINADYTT